MLITAISIYIFIATSVNGGRVLPFNPNLAPNTSDPIESLQSKLQPGANGINLMTINDIHEQEPDIESNPGNPSLALKLTTDYSIKIHKKPFTSYYTSEISHIYSTQKFTTTYAASLPTIINLAYSRINMFNPNALRNAQVGIKNFYKFMDILHVKPMTVHDLNDAEFVELDSVLQLLILSSRAIIHQFAFTDIWDRRDEYYFDEIGTPSTELYPWLDEQQIDRDCTLDLMKIVYWHSYDHLSAQVGSKLPTLDSVWGFVSEKHKYIEELINKWNFIPWSRDVVEKMSEIRDWEEFAECYAVGTATVFDSFFDEDEIKELSRNFLAGFEMDKDYDKVMKNACDQICQ